MLPEQSEGALLVHEHKHGSDMALWQSLIAEIRQDAFCLPKNNKIPDKIASMKPMFLCSTRICALLLQRRHARFEMAMAITGEMPATQPGSLAETLGRH